MEPLRKAEHNNALFNFSFVYQDTKSPQSELPNHMHDYYEMIYVYGGKGTFFIGDTFYDMERGNVFLIPNNTIHRALPDKYDPVTSTIIFFSPALIYNSAIDDSFSFLNLFELTKKTKNYKLSLHTEQQKKIEVQLQDIHQETTTGEIGSKHASLLITHQILLDLYRCRLRNKEGKTETHNHGPNWIKEILAYIDTNLSEPLSLERLADEALVSPAHFSRIFKQTTGMGLTVYLNTKRVIKAKQMLLETDYIISSIAEMSGFESVTHFHRIFKKYVDTTPSKYRKENKTAIQG